MEKPSHPVTQPSPAETAARFAESALGQAIAGVGKTPPTDLDGLRAVLANYGRVTAVPFPFSDSPNDIHFEAPRVVISVEEPSDFQTFNLHGRVFLAVNLYWDKQARKFKIRNIEFISWNRKRAAYDFGLLEEPGLKPTFRATEECAVCHRNHGPIFPAAPWSHSTANLALTRAFLGHLKTLDKDRYGDAHTAFEEFFDKHGKDADVQDKLSKEKELLKVELIPGVPLIPSVTFPNGPTIASGNLTLIDFLNFQLGTTLYNQQYLAAIADPKVRKEAVHLLLAQTFDNQVRPVRDGTILVVEDYSGKLKKLLEGAGVDGSKLPAARGNALLDYNRAADKVAQGATSALATGERLPTPENARLAAAFDEKLRAGKGEIPKPFRASEPTAFGDTGPPRSSVPFQSHTSDLDDATHLLSIPEAESHALRGLFQQALSKVRKQNPALSEDQARAALQKAVLASPPFAKLSATGYLPTREGYREGFVAGLRHALREDLKIQEDLSVARDFLKASLPTTAPNGPAATAAATFRCSPCHANPNSRLFIPFDPTDPEAWKKKDAAVGAWLPKVIERLADGSMPPTADEKQSKALQPQRDSLLRYLRALPKR